MEYRLPSINAALLAMVSGIGLSSCSSLHRVVLLEPVADGASTEEWNVAIGDSCDEVDRAFVLGLRGDAAFLLTSGTSTLRVWLEPHEFRRILFGPVLPLLPLGGGAHYRIPGFVVHLHNEGDSPIAIEAGALRLRSSEPDLELEPSSVAFADWSTVFLSEPDEYRFDAPLVIEPQCTAGVLFATEALDQERVQFELQLDDPTSSPMCLDFELGRRSVISWTWPY